MTRSYDRKPSPVALLTVSSLLALAPACSKKNSESARGSPPAATPTAPVHTDLKDADITHAVETTLARDPGVDAKAIKVSTTNGIVELTGKVSDLLSKRRTEMLAEGVKGVRAVSDRVELVPKERSDAELVKAVKDGLLYNAGSDSFEVDVQAKNGVVKLSGTVDSWQEHALAEYEAESVSGVREVQNELQVRYTPSRSDAEIRADIESRFRWDRLINDGLIRVKVAAGRVTLEGIVGSAAERRRAERSAWVAGVKNVEGKALEVEWWAKRQDLRRNKYGHRSDSQVAQAIRDALALDPRVESAGVIPTVDSGTATLAGHVRSPAAKMAAQALARNTVGVDRVQNQLEVVPRKPVADHLLRDRVHNALLYDAVTDAYQIDVTSSDATVTLSGTVDNSFERARAGEVAASVAGVKRVENRLDVHHPELAYVYDWYIAPYEPLVELWHYVPSVPAAPDALITSRIENELEWSPFVDASHVNVTVVGGKAVLSGEVESPRERTAAVENAFEGGAIAVDDQLRVKPG